jgi:hypothetical protein
MNCTGKALTIALLVLTLATPVSAGPGNQGNPGVIPPQSRPFGLTYGEWSARWWQWALSLPTSAHPLFDTADCSTGQTGHVWFLGGTFAAVPGPGGTLVGSATRSCTVPAGTALFFPVLNSECSTAEGNGSTDAELRSCAEFLVDHTVASSATVDGRSIQNLDRYRKQSPLFQYGPLPADNLLGLPAGTTSDAVADGFYLFLAPLSAGDHTIHFSGELVFTTAADGFDLDFLLDITYNITVASGP